MVSGLGMVSGLARGSDFVPGFSTGMKNQKQSLTSRHDGAVKPPDGLLVPGALSEELLQRLVGVGDVEPRRRWDPVGDGLEALAVAVLAEVAEGDAAPAGLAGPVEEVRETLGVRGEPSEDVPTPTS